MSCALKKKLVLFVAVVYTVFACDYIVLCNRNTHTINLLQSINLVFAKKEIKISSVNKSSSTKKKTGKKGFLARPRVIIQKMGVPDFSIVTLLFLLLFSVCFFPTLNFLSVHSFRLANPYPGIIFFNNWRI